MSYESNYFNLSSVPSGWTEKEFSFAVEVLESLSEAALLNLQRQFKIVFSAPVQRPDKEQIIFALFADTHKEELLAALKTINK